MCKLCFKDFLFLGMQMFRKLYDMDEENFNGVVSIHLTNSVFQPFFFWLIYHLKLQGLSYTSVQSLHGLSHTTGSIFNDQPTPRPILLSSFMLPYKQNAPQKLTYNSRYIVVVVNSFGNIVKLCCVT